MTQRTGAWRLGPVSEGLEQRLLLGGDEIGFVDMMMDGFAGVDGLAYADSVAISPDGLHVYAAGRDDNAIAVFRRDARQSTTTFLQVLKDGEGGVDGLAGVRGVAVSPDGRSVYAAGYGDDAVAIFSRDLATGLLAFQQVLKDGVGRVDGLAGVASVTLSPDGKQVYAAGSNDNSLVVFNRSARTGALSFVQKLTDGIGNIDGLEGVSSVIVSLDGKRAYAAGTGENALAVFGRAAGGRLTPLQVVRDSDPGVDGLNGISAVAVSPDGKHVYTTAGGLDNAVAAFAWEAATGKLTWQQVLRNGDVGINGLWGASALALSPDGAHLYATGALSNAVTLFARDATTGTLAAEQELVDGVGLIEGLAGACAVAATADGMHLYVTGAADNALAILAAPNRAPVLDPSGAMALASVTNDDDTNAGSLVSEIIASAGLDRITDPDLTDPEGIAVTAVDGACGTWQYTLDGSTWLSFATPSATAARLLAADYITRVRLVPLAGFTGRVAEGLTFRAWDQSAGVSGDTADTSAVGGSTAFSTRVETAEISVTDPHLVYRANFRNGVGGVVDVALSPDGQHLYVASSTTNSLVAYRRNAGTGDLTLLGTTQKDGLNGVEGLFGISAVAVSPDGRHVYATAYEGSALTVFRWDAATEKLTFLQVLREGIGGVTGLTGATALSVSPDGRNVFVAGRLDEALAVFSRNPATGGLAFLQVFMDNVDGVDGLNEVEDVVVSPDGRFVYAAAAEEDEVSFFARDLKTGALKYLDRVKNLRVGIDGIAGVTSLAISPDGRYLYAVGNTVAIGSGVETGTGAVAVFRRDVAKGGLTFVQVLRDGQGGLDGLTGVSSVSVSPDGTHVYVTAEGDNALADFRRDPATGRLSFQQVLVEAVRGVGGLAGAASAVVSSDGVWIYVAGFDSRAVSLFQALNSAPVLDLSGDPILDPVAPADSNSPGTAVSTIIARLGGGGITDFDPGAARGLAIIGVDNTHGRWQFTTDWGNNWSEVGAPSDVQALLLTALVDIDRGPRDRLRFVPDAGFTGMIPDAIQFRAWDQTSGLAGSMADASTNGGSTAFSAAWEAADIGVFPYYMIGKGHPRALVYTDADGTVVTISLTGGTATVMLAGDNQQQTSGAAGLTVTGDNLEAAAILLAGTTATSSLAIRTAMGTIPGAVAGTIAAYSPLGTLAAPTIDLKDRLVVNGTLAKLALDDIPGPCRLVIGGSEAAKTPVAMTFDQVADLSIDSAMPIRSITVAEWLNPTPSPSGITAPWVGSLAITGRGGASGDFEGYLQLTSTAAKQNLGTMTVAGWLSASDVHSAGPIGAVTVGGARSSRILAGVNARVTDLPGSIDDFGVLTSIKSLTVKGMAGQAKCFINTDVAAWTLGAVSVRGVETTNGHAFGIVGHSLTSYTLDGTRKPKALAPAVVDHTGDYWVELI